MSMLTVRSLDPSVKSKLRERAARHGRSMEAEVRAILADAVADDDLRPSIADLALDHFSDITVELELPDRQASMPRPVDL